MNPYDLVVPASPAAARDRDPDTGPTLVPVPSLRLLHAPIGTPAELAGTTRGRSRAAPAVVRRSRGPVDPLDAEVPEPERPRRHRYTESQLEEAWNLSAIWQSRRDRRSDPWSVAYSLLDLADDLEEVGEDDPEQDTGKWTLKRARAAAKVLIANELEEDGSPRWASDGSLLWMVGPQQPGIMGRLLGRKPRR